VNSERSLSDCARHRLITSTAIIRYTIKVRFVFVLLFLRLEPFVVQRHCSKYHQPTECAQLDQGTGIGMVKRDGLKRSA